MHRPAMCRQIGQARGQRGLTLEVNSVDGHTYSAPLPQAADGLCGDCPGLPIGMRIAGIFVS